MRMSKDEILQSSINSAIDSIGFYAGNYVLSKFTEIPKPKMAHTGLFFLSNVGVRTYNYTSDKMKRDAIVSGISFVLGTGYDIILKKKSASSAVIDNLAYNAVGFGTNELIDRFIIEKYIDTVYV